MTESDFRSRSAPWISGLFLVLAAVLFVCAAPILEMHLEKIRNALASGPAAVAAALLAFAFILFLDGVRRSPQTTAAATGTVLLILVAWSGNLLAFGIAAAVLAFTLLTGDAVARLLRGFEGGRGELSVSIAAGCGAIGLGLLLLGEIHFVRPVSLIAAAAVLVLVRRRRIPQLARLVTGGAKALWTGPFTKTDALWIAAAAAILVPGFLAALRPDLSWDALAYHLPQVRDFAVKTRVEPLANLYPSTFLWRNYDTFLGLGFLAGGDRTVRFLHFAMGLATFGATASLARRLGSAARRPLAVLALCAFPAACLELKNTYVDLPAGLLLTASAAEIAASRAEGRRLRLAGFLFGGAIATKLFAILGTPALAAIFACRRRDGLRCAIVFSLCAGIVLLPWLAWSQSRLGFFLAPYYDPRAADRNDPNASIYGPPIQPSNPGPSPRLDVQSLLRLPFDLTLGEPQYSRLDDYVGLLPLLLLLGLAGFGARDLRLFAAAAVVSILPWYAAASRHLIHFDARYLIPLFPMYAAAAGVGLERATGQFRGSLGSAAAAAAAMLTLAVPTQLLSAPHDLDLALRRATPETALAALPAYPLWRHVHSQDRVLLLGDPDRFHCPARVVVNDMLVFPEPEVDPNRWQREWRPLGITHILHREDRRDAAGLLRALGPCVHLVASHNVASLYRVEGTGSNCSVDRADRPGMVHAESKDTEARAAGAGTGGATGR
jgi:glycosyl transferase family 87